MEQNLWVIRGKSFAWTLLGVVLTAIFGYLLSSDFSALLTEYTGTAITGTLVTMVLTELAKHLRNKGVIAGMKKRLGSMYSQSKPDLI